MGQDRTVTVRAIVFDLWDTLVDWPVEASRRLRLGWAERLGVSPERLDELWYAGDMYRRRETGPLLPVVRELCEAAGASVDPLELVESRLELTRSVFSANGGVLDTLAELRRRGVAIGLISNCTQDVAVVWPGTSLAATVDCAIFSAVAGCMKPDAEIYELVCAGLGVQADACLFVGDGANGELDGAARVGMTPALLERSHGPHPWDAVRDWSGLRLRRIPDVLALVSPGP